jgi:hypothetical protein
MINIFVIKQVRKIFRNKRLECTGKFVDFYKAFYSIYKDGLLFKIYKKTGLSEKVVKCM